MHDNFKFWYYMELQDSWKMLDVPVGKMRMILPIFV